MSWKLFKINAIKADGKYTLIGGPFGSNLVSNDYCENGVPVIRGANLPFDKRFSHNDLVFVSDEKAKKLFSNYAYPNDIIFTQRGTLGQIGLIPEGHFDRYIVSQSQMKLTVNAKFAIPEFVYYYFKSDEGRKRIESYSITSGVPHINLGILKSLEIPIPPLPTQQKIASILSAYDDLIENNLQRIKLLEEAAQNIYKEWFVHFRFPGAETVAFENGLPQGWEKKSLSCLCNLTMGQSPSSDFYNNNKEGLPFHQGVTNYGDRFITHETYCTQFTRIADEEDILCSVRAPVGRLNITLDKIVIGRGLSAISNKKDYQSFQYYQLKNHFFQEDMIGGGSIFNSVTKKELESQILLSPSCNVIEKFEEVVKPIDEQIKTLHYQNQKLKEARDILLPRLMNQTIELFQNPIPLP